MFEEIRKKVFWIADTFQHSAVRKQYEDILNIQKQEGSSLNLYLCKILEYAIRNVPFYEQISEPELQNFPVMSKSIYKEHGQQCRSREYLENKKNFPSESGRK